MDTDGRRRALVEAGIALTSELSLEAVLDKLVRAAAELTGARYAALGIVDSTGRRLDRFLTHGVTPEEHEAIGALPIGRGILGVLIRDPRPLRLHDLADDPRSVGFPPHHPPMRTFLGVPVLTRGISYGRLYLTEKEGGADFSEEDEEVVTLLAAQAAVAIDLSQRVGASCPPPRRCGARVGAAANCSGAARRDGSGAHVDTARAGGRRAGRPARGPAGGAR